MYIREVAPTELACCMRSCVRPVRLIQSWLRRKRARSQRCSFESPSVAYGSPEHCQSTEHGSTSSWTTSQKIKVRVYSITCPLCKGLVTSERMGGTADVRVRNMGTISCRPFTYTGARTRARLLMLWRAAAAAAPRADAALSQKRDTLQGVTCDSEIL